MTKFACWHCPRNYEGMSRTVCSNLRLHLTLSMFVVYNQDRRPRPMVSAKAVRNQMVPSLAEWRGETDNRATPPVGYCPSTASFSVRPYCKNARRDRCQEYHNCFSFGGLEETTRTSSNYVDEDYPERPEIKQSFTGWGDNCGSESSTLETDVCVWRYAPLVVLATQEEEEESVRVQLRSASTRCIQLTRVRTSMGQRSFAFHEFETVCCQLCRTAVCLCERSRGG